MQEAKAGKTKTAGEWITAVNIQYFVGSIPITPVYVKYFVFVGSIPTRAVNGVDST